MSRKQEFLRAVVDCLQTRGFHQVITLRERQLGQDEREALVQDLATLISEDKAL